MINKYQGCLLGLAIGDALGAPVEFLTSQEIKKYYGNKDGVAPGNNGHFGKKRYSKRICVHQ